MDYKVVKVEAKTVQKQGQNFNKKYVVCTIENEENDDVREVSVFDREADKYLACIAIAAGGTSQTGDQPIPEKNSIWKNVTDEMFIFPEPMVRVGDNGKPALNKFGQMYIRESCRVTTRYNYDPMRTQMKDVNGNPLSAFVPKPGWDLTTRGTSVMNAFYIPLRVVNAASGGNNGTVPPGQGDEAF